MIPQPKKIMACESDPAEFLRLAGGLENVVWSVKWDGKRCLALVPEKGGAYYYSRNKSRVKNMDAHTETLRRMAADAVKKFGVKWPVIFDGEAIGPVYHVFDLVDEAGFMRRYEMLASVFSVCADQNVRLVEHHSFEEPGACVERLLDTTIAAGHEGLVLKTRDGRYGHGLSFSWCKLVKNETADLEVVEVIEGKGRLSGKVGAFVCLCNGTLVKVAPGRATGKDLERFFSDPPQLIEVAFKEITKSGALREPRFVRVRDDKNEPHVPARAA